MEINRRQQSRDENALFKAVLVRMAQRGAITMGQTLRLLRKEHLGLSRREFAKKVRLSFKAVGEIETDQGNPTLSSLNKAFGKFGIQIGLQMLQNTVASELVLQISEDEYETVAEQILGLVAGT